MPTVDPGPVRCGETRPAALAPGVRDPGPQHQTLRARARWAERPTRSACARSTCAPRTSPRRPCTRRWSSSGSVRSMSASAVASTWRSPGATIGRPANQIIGLGDWQSGHAHPDHPERAGRCQHQSPLSGYQFEKRNDEDDFEDELGDEVYGSGTGPHGEYRHWHDQHLKARRPDRHDARGAVRRAVAAARPGLQVQALASPTARTTTSSSPARRCSRDRPSSADERTIHPLVIDPCAPVGDAVVQLWRTIPIDSRRQNRSPFGRGEFTVMAGRVQSRRTGEDSSSPSGTSTSGASRSASCSRTG